MAADSRLTTGELRNAVGTDDLENGIKLLCERGLIVSLPSGRFEFTHPLIRNATYLTAPDAARKEAHQRLAGAVSSPDISRRAWHLALAATGPDESAAIELDAAATYALECGDALAAGRSLARAAQTLNRNRVPTDSYVRGWHFLKRGVFQKLLTYSTRHWLPHLIRFYVPILSFSAPFPTYSPIGPARLQESLVDLGTQLLDLDAGRSAMAGVLAALVSFSCSRMNEVRALCQRALDADGSGAPIRALAQLLCAFEQALGGEVTASRAVLLEHTHSICDAPDQVEMSSAAFLAETLMWTGDWSMSSRLISTLIRQCHRAR